ncbi:MAG: CAP domain-containing protein [Octadecabacter sp.]
MLRRSFTFGSMALGLAACTGGQPAIGPDGLPSQQIYRISAQDSDDIQFRVLDGLNALRDAAGAQPLQLNAQLTAAAATHSRDMSVQNRPWHFGSDGSSPIDRLRRVGYGGALTGETISETYETEIETLGAWMQAQSTRAVLLNSESNEMGFAWFQESNGKIWYTLVLANRNERPIVAQENAVPLQDAAVR